MSVGVEQGMASLYMLVLTQWSKSCKSSVTGKPWLSAARRKVLHDWVGVIAEGDLDRALKAMNVSVVASSLVSLMLLHQWNQLFGSPALHLNSHRNL